MKTIYVLDTSALIYDPEAYKSFPYSEIIIPHMVTKELDKLKKQAGEVGRNARVAIKQLEAISQKGDISTGIELDDHILLRVDATYYDPSLHMFAGFGDPTYGDTHILMCVYHHQVSNPGDVVTLVSNDFHLRLSAKLRGADACPIETKASTLSDLYSGVQVIDNEDAGLDLQKQGFIDPRIYGLAL